MSESWRKHTSDQVVNWLLEEDRDNAPVRFLALRDLLDENPSSKRFLAAREFMMKSGL
jgi:hypothetical protein